MVPKFVKVMPKDYKRVLQSHQERVEAAGLSGEEAIMAAFEENAQRRRPHRRRLMHPTRIELSTNRISRL